MDDPSIRHRAPARDPPLAHEILHHITQCWQPGTERRHDIRHIRLRITTHVQEHTGLKRGDANGFERSPELKILSGHATESCT
jgi:hypothetical protein